MNIVTNSLIAPRLTRFTVMLITWIALSMFMLNAFALVAVPPLQHRVTDLTQTLSAQETSQLEAKLAQFEQEKGSQIAVLLVPTTKPEEIDQFSIRVVDQWKLGREKQDDGVLVLVAKNDRKVRIEVGYGLEGAIPDVYAKRLITEVIAPKFRQGNVYGGLDQVTTKIMQLIDGEQLAPPTSKTQGQVDIMSLLPMLFIGGMVLGGILKAMFGSFLGSALTGGAIGFIAWTIGGAMAAALLFGIVGFFISLIGAGNMMHVGGLGGGGFGGGRSGGFDPFGGGGGGFGGGGASGDW